MIIPVDYAQINLLFTGNGAPTGAQCTFGILNSVGKTADEICDAVDTALGSSLFENTFSSELTLSGILAKRGPNETGTAALKAVTRIGDLGSAAAVPNTATLAIKNTDLGGRKGRGRMFIPGVVETDVNQAGTLTSTRITSLEGIFSDLIADLATNNVPMVLLHSDSTTPSEVLTLVPSSKVATQRRRLRR